MGWWSTHPSTEWSKWRVTFMTIQTCASFLTMICRWAAQLRDLLALLSWTIVISMSVSIWKTLSHWKHWQSIHLMENSSSWITELMASSLHRSASTHLLRKLRLTRSQSRSKLEVHSHQITLRLVLCSSSQCQRVPQMWPARCLKVSRAKYSNIRLKMVWPTGPLISSRVGLSTFWQLKLASRLQMLLFAWRKLDLYLWISRFQCTMSLDSKCNTWKLRILWARRTTTPTVGCGT